MRVGGLSLGFDGFCCGLVGVSFQLFVLLLYFCWLLLVYSLYTFRQPVGFFVFYIYCLYPLKKKKFIRVDEPFWCLHGQYCDRGQD